MALNINIFLLLFGALQGILLSLLLLRRRCHRQAFVFLAVYWWVMIAQLLLKVLSKGWLMTHVHGLYRMSYQLPLLYGPLVYLMIRQMLYPSRTLGWKDALHFLPFGIGAFLVLGANAQALPTVVTIAFFSPGSTIFQVLTVGIYHVLALRLWQYHHQPTSVKWLRPFVVLSWIICTAIPILLFLIFKNYPTLNYLRWGFVSLTIFIYWVTYAALRWPEELIPMQDGGKTHGAKYANSSLKAVDRVRIIKDLTLLMQEEQVFLDPDLTIEKLASRLSTSRHHLSQALNEQLGQSFFDYVNRWRIERAKDLLRDPDLSHQKIAAIAYDAGFNSLSTFNEVFRKTEGQTPSQFRKGVGV